MSLASSWLVNSQSPPSPSYRIASMITPRSVVLPRDVLRGGAFRPNCLLESLSLSLGIVPADWLEILMIGTQ